MRIELLESKKYRGKQLIFKYRTERYYDIEIKRTMRGSSFALVEKQFEGVQEKQFTDTLLDEWLEDPKLFGVFDNDEVIAYLELSHERWNNRMRISNIYVEAAHRGHGIGKQLISVAEQTAGEEKVRMLILETQSCNYNAIRFYQSCGFSVIGFDLFAYSNEDVEKKEFRLEMGKRLEI
ncbi:MAG TPA: GNAT family N-acetyltransferase [Thermotogota bacterium]|nr:GNAT family N-acetyltransferase [Thermotogota bacterium]HPR97201.1 GNAT family N-acetyltransferase [Thermotogota bacterium]